MKRHAAKWLRRRWKQQHQRRLVRMRKVSAPPVVVRGRIDPAFFDRMRTMGVRVVAGDEGR